MNLAAFEAIAAALRDAGVRYLECLNRGRE